MTITITKVENKGEEENIFNRNWHFTTDNKDEIIISEEILDEIICDYLRRHTNLGR